MLPFKIYSQNPDANMIVAPSDHLITNEQEFVRVAKEGMSATAANDILLTIGILPSRPDTGYGYIQFNDASLESNADIKEVKTFTEKPDQELALQFLDSGDFLWNSGIFIWNAEKIIKSLKKHLPDIHDIFEEGKHSFNTKKKVVISIVHFLDVKTYQLIMV